MALSKSQLASRASRIVGYSSESARKTNVDKGYVKRNSSAANKPVMSSSDAIVERYTPPEVTPTINTNNKVITTSQEDTGNKFKGFGASSSDEIGTEEEDLFDYKRYQENIKDSQDELEKEKEIRRQGLIDAITQKYDTNISGIKETGASELARTRTMNLRSGLIESPMGATEIGSTEKKTTDALAKNEALKNDEINKAVNELDDLYYTREQTAKEEDKTSLEEHKASVKTIISSLAKNGVSFDKFKLDPDYQKLLRDGFTDTELQATFITGADKDSFISDTPEIIGSTAFWFQKQGDGTVKKVSLDLGVQDNSIEQVVKTDKGVIVIKKDGTYQNIGGADNPTGAEVKTEAAQKVAGYMNTIADDNGIVTPGDYARTKRAWITDGFTSADFDKQFVSYIDPKKMTEYGFDQETLNALKKPATFIINQ